MPPYLARGLFYAVIVVLALPFSGLATDYFWPEKLTPETPPMLRNAYAGGGWHSGGCRSDRRRDIPEALSPHLTPRLARDFPIGSDAGALRESLLSQGFESIEPCPDDPTTQRAHFRQRGGGIFGPFPVAATIAWKQSQSGQVEWIKAFVAYTGP